MGFRVTGDVLDEKLVNWIEENIFPTYDYISGDTYLFDTDEILGYVDEENQIAGFGEVTEMDIDILRSADYIEI